MITDDNTDLRHKRQQLTERDTQRERESVSLLTELSRTLLLPALSSLSRSVALSLSQQLTVIYAVCQRPHQLRT